MQSQGSSTARRLAEEAYSRSMEVGMSVKIRRIAIVNTLILLLVIIILAACSKPEKPSFRAFASPDDAGNGLLEAAKSGDQNVLLTVFGPQSKDIIFSGDAVQDK